MLSLPRSRFVPFACCLLLTFAVVSSRTLPSEPETAAPTSADTGARYIERYRDPVIEAMRQAQTEEATRRRATTEAIRERQTSEAPAPSGLRFAATTEGLDRPESPDDFATAFHFPPVSQDRTGGCWCFAGLSFYESEIHRLSGRQLRLSEMYIIYHEYVEKVRRFVRERGASRVSLGSEINAVPRMMTLYGSVPLETYTGLLGSDRHEHIPLFNEIKAYLEMVETNELWDETHVLTATRAILNKHLGEPPTAFEHEGRSLSPHEFLREVCRLELDDYRVAMSTLSVPYYTRTVLDVPDNWWRCDNYHNLPLDVWYATLREALRNGYTVGICGDTTEPGYLGEEDVAFVPPFDIPSEAIGPAARELRIANGATTDDHCIHIVGHAQRGDHDWYLVKDSSRSPHPGRFWGYRFYRDDYVRLKMLSYLVHKDALAPLLDRFENER